MITLTKEWLLKTIAQLEEERDAVPGAVNEDAARALAAMKLALASLEAEAVAYVDPFAFHNFSVYRAGENDNKRMGRDWMWANPDEGLIPVYTAPPAPAVPEAVTAEDVRWMLKQADHDDGPKCRIEHAEYIGAMMWNACRAAMLQGAEHVSNRDELPDGWVACSERMPEDEQQVITHNIFGYRHISFFDEHSGHFFDHLDGRPIDCVEHVLVSHWMPMPAAPQQEV